MGGKGNGAEGVGVGSGSVRGERFSSQSLPKICNFKTCTSTNPIPTCFDAPWHP